MTKEERNSKIDLYLATNAKYFEPSVIPILRSKLENADESKFIALQAIELKDPTAFLIISIFFGYLGLDRFLLGDIGIGVLKLLTLGCCGVLTIVDWFNITKLTKQKNFESISMVI